MTLFLALLVPFALLALGIWLQLRAPFVQGFICMIDGSTGIVPSDAERLPVWNGEHWELQESDQPLRFPVPVRVGQAITEWVVHCHRPAGNAEPWTITARLQQLDLVTGQHVTVGDYDVVNTAPPGHFILTAVIPPTKVSEDGTFSLLIQGEGSLDHVLGAAVLGEPG